MLHLDGLRLGDEPGFAGLLLAPFVGVAQVYEVIARLRSLGITVIDPHTWLLGSHVPNAQTWEQYRRIAARFDPEGLLNPGRIPPAQQADDDLAVHRMSEGVWCTRRLTSHRELGFGG